MKEQDAKKKMYGIQCMENNPYKTKLWIQHIEYQLQNTIHKLECKKACIGYNV